MFIVRRGSRRPPESNATAIQIIPPSGNLITFAIDDWAPLPSTQSTLGLPNQTYEGALVRFTGDLLLDCSMRLSVCSTAKIPDFSLAMITSAKQTI